ncbi:MAG: M16 family metallopeptidase [Thermoanaerobaculia bacterium]
MKLLPVLLLAAALPIAAETPKKADSMSLPKDLPALLPEKPLSSPEVVTATLPNGLAVQVVRQDGVPLANVRLVVKGGLSDDPPAGPGFAQLLADGLKEGTASRSGPQLATAVQEAGGDLATAASSDALTVAASGLAGKTTLLLDLVSDVARNASFPVEGVARVKALAHERLETDESDPSFVATRAFAKALYGSHPYGVIAPTTASIDSVTPERLRAESRRRLRPERSLLLVVGAVDSAAVTREAARLFGSWKGIGEAPPALPNAKSPAGENRFEILDRPGSVQTALLVGLLGPLRTSPDASALELAMTIYGGAFSSRLVQNLREEKGYTYSPGAGVRWLAGRGSVRSRAAVRSEVTGASLGEIFYEMTRMGTTEPTDEEMDRARRVFTGLKAISLQTSPGLADELAQLWILGLPPSEIGRTSDALAKVTKADVKRVSKEYLAAGRARVVAVGDAKVIRAELAPFGESCRPEPGH